jgi:hypothetical protein
MLKGFRTFHYLLVSAWSMWLCVFSVPCILSADYHHTGVPRAQVQSLTNVLVALYTPAFRIFLLHLSMTYHNFSNHFSYK